jgi:hypothetical protein
LGYHKGIHILCSNGKSTKIMASFTVFLGWCTYGQVAGGGGITGGMTCPRKLIQKEGRIFCILDIRRQQRVKEDTQQSKLLASYERLRYSRPRGC